MWDPGLSPRDFIPDEELLSVTLCEQADFTALHDASAPSIDPVYTASPDPLRVSQCNVLALEIDNNAQYDALIGVTHRQNFDPGTGVDAAISFSGGRAAAYAGTRTTLLFSRESFGFYGRPTGFEGIREIRITATYEKDHVGRERPVIRPIRLKGIMAPRPFGPRLTESGLETVLSCSPEVAIREFRSSHKARDHWGALNVPPPNHYLRESADEIIAGRIQGLVHHPEVNWAFNPIGEHEWTHFLNRHDFLTILTREFTETGDRRYSAAFEALAAHWIERMPAPVGENGGAGPGWETLSAAQRLRVWARTAPFHAKLFSDHSIRLLLRSIWEHALHLMDHKGHANNWRLLESAALYKAGLCFPFFRDAETWRSEGAARLQREAQRQFFDDGAHFELSPLYHALCAHALTEALHTGAERGAESPDSLFRVTQKAFGYLSGLARPDLTWPAFNDSGSMNEDHSALLGYMQKVLEACASTRAASPGEGAHGRDPRIRVFPNAGIGIVRSGKDRRAHYLAFRAGPAGAAHVHDDALSLDVTVFSAPMLVDPGVTRYAPDALTDAYRSAAAHNVTLIDGRGPVRSRLPYLSRLFSPSPLMVLESRSITLENSEAPVNVEGFRGTCNGPWENGESAELIRTVLFVDSCAWIVRDEVTAPGAHHLTTVWQFAPGRVEVAASGLAASYRDASGPGLEVIPLGPRPDHVEVCVGLFGPARGWVSVSGSDISAASVRYHFSMKDRASIDWLLQPIELGDPPVRGSAEIERLAVYVGHILTRIQDTDWTDACAI